MIKLHTVRSKIVLLLLVGLIGFLSNAGVNRYTQNIKNSYFDLTRDSQEIKLQVFDSLRLEQQFISRRNAEVLDRLQESENQLQASIDMLKGRLNDQAFQKQVEELDSAQQQHRGMFQQIAANLERMDAARNALAETAGKVSAGIREIVDAITMEATNLMMTGEDLPTEMSAFRDLAKDLLISINLKTLNLQDLFVLGDVEQYKIQREQLEKRLIQDRQNMENSAKDEKLSDFHKTWAEVVSLLDESEKLEATTFSEWELNGKLSTNLQNAVALVGKQAGLISTQATEMATHYDRLGSLIGLGILALTAVSFLLIGGLSIRFIQRSLKSSISKVDMGSNRVAETAEQLQNASTGLASGASEQAASLEETSSSLEEMSAMTNKNAANAGEAESMMVEATGIVEKVNNHMEDMAAAINEITRSSEETGKIIKTIDEIAFQTNLLALNAAVEAARAGEAGAGFAVVADEVRNLAMRAAEAARNTAELIENTIKAVKSGNELTQSTREVFKENVEISGKVGDLVAEIAAASKEQAQGLDQINRAVGEIDKVTQQNAANAEESASAAEEMSNQARQMKSVVRDLASLVDSKQEVKKKNNKKTGKKTAFPSGELDPASTSGGLPPVKSKALKDGSRVQSFQVISLAEEDFKDF